VFLDSAHSATEDRFVIIGMSAAARLLVRPLLQAGGFDHPHHLGAQGDPEGGANL
jgi:hypothetical protein